MPGMGNKEREISLIPTIHPLMGTDPGEGSSSKLSGIIGCHTLSPLVQLVWPTQDTNQQGLSKLPLMNSVQCCHVF